MNIYQPAYYISQENSWPNETFTIAISDQLIDPDLGFLPIINDAILLKNPINSITNGFLPIGNKPIGINSLIDYSYYQSFVGLSEEGVLQIDLNRASTLQWATSALRRKYEAGPLFNMMQIDVTPGADETNKMYRGYLIFPPKLQLKPTSLAKTGSNWSLTTQTVVKTASTFFTSFSTVDILGYDIYKKYIKNIPVTQPLPSGYTLFYEICGTTTRVDRPIINFTETYNPNYFSNILEPPGSKIRPDSTSVFYNIEYYSRQEDGSNIIIDLGQENPIDTDLISPFRATYLLNYDPVKDPNKQYFQLIQKLPFTLPPLNTFRLSESGFCVLSGVFDLNISNFKYFNHNYFISTGLTNTLVMSLTGIPGTSLSVNYIADRPRIFFTNETVQSTAAIAGATSSFGTPVATNPGQTLTWTTKYPPHYYSYKALLSSEGFNPLSSTFMDVDSLTFYLYNDPISSTATSVTLSTYIKSDFNFLKYDLFTNNYNNEYIQYKPLLTEDLIISAVECFYGPNLNKPYSLFESPWIPVSEGQNFTVSYPNVEYGEISLVITSTLSSVNGFLDAKEIEPIVLAQGLPPRDPRSQMTIDLVAEFDDYLIADASFISNETSYPFRDLTDSYISWYYYPSGSYIRLDGVDQNLQYLTTIPAYSSVLFDDKTWTVRMSGYGPETTILFLSSQKYNTVASVTSNSAYFDFFREGRFVVGPSIQLNNLNKTRTITLTAAVPYKNRIYQLPSNVYIYWEWYYDDEEDISNQIIQASYVNSASSYFTGIELPSTQISALNFKITPNYADASPNTHKVSVYAISNYYNFTNETRAELEGSTNLQGKYEFFVDDFPDPSIFNTDFLISYSTGLKPLITNTRSESLNNRTAVITRPVTSTNTFSLTGNIDVLPSLVIPSNGSIVWSVSNDINGIFSSSSFVSGTNVFYNLDLTNPASRKTLVTLSALNCIVPGWVSAHNTSCDAMFYIIPATEFNTPLAFLIYPPYAWLSGRYLTLLDNNNYTLSLSPTAYANKASDSQNYYVSANLHNFSSYIYAINSNNILSNTNSPSSEIEVPYTTSIYSVTGQQIGLSAYNQEYPLYNGTTFIDHFEKLKTYPNNRSTSVPFYLSTSPLFQYRRNPRVIPYDNVILSFNVINSAIDLDKNRFITINQNISSFNAAQPIPSSSTVTYTISTEYWTTVVKVPATNGIQNLTLLNVGDPYYENFVSNTKNTNLYLSAVGSILAQIPSSTFDNYSVSQYSDNRDLWTAIYQNVIGNIQNPWSTIVAYNTGKNPEMFLSSYYTVTSHPILIQFFSPSTLQDPSSIVTDYKISIEDTVLSIPASGYAYYYPTKAGSFNVSYSAFYLNNLVKGFNLDIPLIIKSDWDQYNQEDIRILDEVSLNLPYSREQIEIQPNEWGDADIFNNALGRIYDNLEYLKLNSQTINTDSPTIYYGWLGCNEVLISEGIRWYTKTYGNEYHDNPSLATDTRSSQSLLTQTTQFNLNNAHYFSSVNGIAESNSHIFALDGSLVRAFSAGNIPVERNFSNAAAVSSLFVTPQSLAIDETGTILYTVDSSKNQIFKFDLDLSYVPYINISNIIGNYGYRIDSNKFNTPTEIVYQNKEVYVLDYGNSCIKHYDDDLNWLYTYYNEDFATNKPINIVVHPSNLLYVLTNDYKIHIFDRFKDSIVQSINLEEVRKSAEVFPASTIVKILFDEPGEFLYIVTYNQVFKYTATGYFLSILNLPEINRAYTSANYSPNRGLLFSTHAAIIKVQDILEIFRIGKGLPANYWSKEQIQVGREEMAQDFVYNRALKRLAQNIKMFRNTLNSKFAITSEVTNNGIIYYFTLEPLNESQKPVLDIDVENETLSVGVNELHIPQTLNKELVKLYNSLSNITLFLNVKDIREDGSELLCSEPFCWSWKATSCYGLKLPMIKVCNINPITYDELKSAFTVNYAPTKSWGLAISDCCKDIESPTIIQN